MRTQFLSFNCGSHFNLPFSKIYRVRCIFCWSEKIFSLTVCKRNLWKKCNYACDLYVYIYILGAVHLLFGFEWDGPPRPVPHRTVQKIYTLYVYVYILLLICVHICVFVTIRTIPHISRPAPHYRNFILF